MFSGVALSLIGDFQGRYAALQTQARAPRLAGGWGVQNIQACNADEDPQIRIGITTYLKPVVSGMVISALEALSLRSMQTMSWLILARASIR